MSVLSMQPLFLYPTSRLYPFDEVAEKIVREIEKRNWKVPGLSLEFATYGSGEEKYLILKTITGKDFRLSFDRELGMWECGLEGISALHEVCMTKQRIRFYQDESGPSYALYVGDDWENDMESFWNFVASQSRLNKQPRKYLLYGNEWNKKRAEFLRPITDGEYVPEYGEPVCIDVQKKYEEITKWLEEYVLNYILQFDEADSIDYPVKPIEVIPYNGPFEFISTVCTRKEIDRIVIGKNNKNELPARERTAIFIENNGKLLSVGCPAFKGTVPQLAYDVFTWCVPGILDNPEIVEKAERSIKKGIVLYKTKRCVAVIKLKYANDVYVIDNTAIFKRLEQAKQEYPECPVILGEELVNLLIERARTIIPVNEYKGNFEYPVVLIKREVEFDEIDHVYDFTEEDKY